MWVRIVCLSLWTQTVIINCLYGQTINTNKVIVTVNIFIVNFKCAVIHWHFVVPLQLKVSVTPHLKCITNSLGTVKDSLNALIYSLWKMEHSPEDRPSDINKMNKTSSRFSFGYLKKNKKENLYYQCFCVSCMFVALECAIVNAQVFINSLGFYSNWWAL